MIISRTPLRISFFGGGSDYKEWLNHSNGEVLSTTIDKYVYISIRNLPKFFKHNFRLSYSKIEDVDKINKINHHAIKGILNYYKQKKGLEIHYDGDLPAKSGMGSSSAFVVGFIKSLYKFNNKKNLSKIELAKKSIFIEQSVLKENVGIQDQIACAHGGFKNIKFNKKNIKILDLGLRQKYLNQLNSNLFLVYSKIQRRAHDIASSFTRNIRKPEKNISLILEQVKIAKSLLKKGNIDDFGKLLGENWELKKKLSSKISNDYIDGLYENAINNGAYGGKILGAGGGGFFLFYVPKKNHEKFKRKFLQNKISIDFNFENEGSKIIYKT